MSRRRTTDPADAGFAPAPCVAGGSNWAPATPCSRASGASLTLVSGTAIEVSHLAMTKLLSASLAFATCLSLACGKVDSAQPRGVAGSPDPANATAPALAPVNNPTVGADGQPVNAQGAATLEFKKRVDAYLKIHNEAETKVPNLK